MRAALAAARALVSPPDHASLVAADTHPRDASLRFGGGSSRARSLGARGEALEVRVLGATMLRAKARSEGFAMTPSDAAAMTAEVLALLGSPDGATALGPHLANLAAAVSAAGGAHVLADLVARAVAHAAPDAAGGWPADGTKAVGPHAHAAVALLAAAAEESLRENPRARPRRRRRHAGRPRGRPLGPRRGSLRPLARDRLPRRARAASRASTRGSPRASS